MSTQPNKKMSLRKYLVIWVPLLSIILVLALAATIVMNIFASSLDTYLGKGNRVVQAVEGTENWDLDYYNKKYSTDGGENGSQLAAAAVAKQISDEGEVLLKNDGILPLGTKAIVTPFGYRYISPVYGGTGSGNVNTSQPYVSTAQSALAEAFQVNTAVEEVMRNATPYELTSTGRNEAARQPDADGFSGAGTSILEFDPSIYEGVADSCEGALGIMTSMNYIGTRYAGCSYDLVTEVLRNEWGFQGAVITDMTGQALDKPERAMRAGTDMWMWYMPGANTFEDLDSATVQWAVRNAIRNICFVTANSNIMQGAAPGATVYYEMSPWMIWLIVCDVVIFGFIAVMAVVVVRRVVDTKKHPEKYKRRGE